jgi:adenylate cyclase class 2
MASGSHETEIKLAVSGVREGRRLLRQAGFRVVKRRLFESNTLFDTARLTLRNARRLLRVRETGGKTKLTFKGTPLISRHKSREELELSIEDARLFAAILDRLGYRPTFRYEKYRTTYGEPGVSGEAVLDETPIGVYLELEGSPRWIDRTARRLGFGEPDYITASYGRLYLDWCRERGVEPKDMLFR